jgi:hypothetical protein
MEAWVVQHGLDWDQAHQSARLAFSVDRARFVLTTHGSHGWLLQARIADLPDENGKRETMIDRAALLATARMARSATALTVDAQRSMLLLQLGVAADLDVPGFEAALEMMTNDIELWRAVL